MDIEKLKQKILDLAIRGKLVPQDPNDEPASVLIEKIRTEKEALIKQGKIKRDKNESYIFKGDDNSYYEKVNGETKKLTIPFSLPDNWTWVRLGSIFKIGSSKRIHKSDWRSNGIPFYRARDIEDINEGSFNSQIYIDPTLYESIKQQYGIPKIGDLLVTAVGTLGKVYIVNNNTPFYYKDGNIICFSNLHNINPFFIKMLFDTDFLKKQIKGDSKGTTVDTYTIIHANNTLIPIPSIREQSRIVSRYDEILTIASKIAVSKSEINALCKQLKISILDFYFGIDSRYKSYYGKRTETTLEKLIPNEKIGDGDWVLSEDMNPNGDIQLLQLKHIGNMVYQNKSFCHIDENFFKEHNCSEIKENYLLINRLVASSMACCLMPQTNTKTITSVDVCWIAPDETYNSKYIMYYLSSKNFQNKVLMLCSGSTRKRISKKNLTRIPLFIHDRMQQDIIVNRIENLFELVEKVIG